MHTVAFVVSHVLNNLEARKERGDVLEPDIGRGIGLAMRCDGQLQPKDRAHPVQSMPWRQHGSLLAHPYREGCANGREEMKCPL
jgi:hypothetical protein